MAISIAEGSDNINIAEKAKIYKNPKTQYTCDGETTRFMNKR
jgi:hypothetical protein